MQDISIHAPRTGSDLHQRLTVFIRFRISIHAPRTGSDRRERQCCRKPLRFQSTLPARGATDARILGRRERPISIHTPRTGRDLCRQHHLYGADDFNPRSPHGERPSVRRKNSVQQKFQSTLPARGATREARRAAIPGVFQSTLPARGATRRAVQKTKPPTISIHAPRTGSDWGDVQSVNLLLISIHAPRTGSDGRVREIRHGEVISIHAPRTGSDRKRSSYPFPRKHFNPRSPHGERLVPSCWFDA